MGDPDSTWDVEAERRALDAYPTVWRIVTTLNLCIAKIVGKYAAYPSVDTAAFERVHGALTRGLNRKKSPSELANFCQELRAVVNCPVCELIRPKGADDTDTRLSAIAFVVRTHAGLDDLLLSEIVTGLLSWNAADKALILKTLQTIIRG